MRYTIINKVEAKDIHLVSLSNSPLLITKLQQGATKIPAMISQATVVDLRDMLLLPPMRMRTQV
ncbi:hypothetical protein D3C86_2162790 [compost metagenome]